MGEVSEGAVGMGQKLKVQEPGARMSEGRRRWTPQIKEPFLSLFVLLGPSRDWMVPVHIVWGESSLPRLLTPVLTTFGNSLTDTLRKNVSPTIWATLSPVKLTHKFNHHPTLLKI